MRQRRNPKPKAAHSTLAKVPTPRVEKSSCKNCHGTGGALAHPDYNTFEQCQFCKGTGTLEVHVYPPAQAYGYRPELKEGTPEAYAAITAHDADQRARERAGIKHDPQNRPYDPREEETA